MSAKHRIFALLLIAVSAFSGACDRNEDKEKTAAQLQPDLPAPCDIDNGGLTLPPGFCAGIVADSLGFIRHLAVSERGDLYATLRNFRLNLGGILALRDTDNDGRYDQIEKFSEVPGMGIRVVGDKLYFAADTDIYRYQLDDNLVPTAMPELLVQNLPKQELHGAKPFAIDDTGHLYVNIGAITNACQPAEQLAGQDPCLELESHAGIWRFSLASLNQTQADGYHYARGIRNAYAIDWHPAHKQLYVVQHGRDQLHEQWPDLYDAEAGARLPSEEFLLIEDGGNYGWPYCYHNPLTNTRILAPEYGGDGQISGRCETIANPLIGFPAHYSPNDLKFYSADQFPEHYRNGAFIAFHGSYNRGAFEQAGYQVVFVPFRDGGHTGGWEIFADGFAGMEEVRIPEDADYRPTGLAIGPDGSLYIADSVQGRVWRVIYTGADTAAAIVKTR